MDHDWLGGDAQKQPITLPRGARYVEGILPRDVLHNKLIILANRSSSFPGFLVAKLPGGLESTSSPCNLAGAKMTQPFSKIGLHSTPRGHLMREEGNAEVSELSAA